MARRIFHKILSTKAVQNINRFSNTILHLHIHIPLYCSRNNLKALNVFTKSNVVLIIR